MDEMKPNPQLTRSSKRTRRRRRKNGRLHPEILTVWNRSSDLARKAPGCSNRGLCQFVVRLVWTQVWEGLRKGSMKTWEPRTVLFLTR